MSGGGKVRGRISRRGITHPWSESGKDGAQRRAAQAKGAEAWGYRLRSRSEAEGSLDRARGDAP